MTDLSAQEPLVGLHFERRAPEYARGEALVGGSQVFWALKRGFDVVVSIIGLPLIGVLGLFLLILNPIANPGPVLFRQKRMGRRGRAITVYKFRTMLNGAARGPEDRLEEDRITPLGRWLRRIRIDELPQFWNVLCGEMSLIGPRPDCYEHAEAFCRVIPGYRERHVVRPGISGYAQVRLGYAEGVALTARKVRFDHMYIRNAGWRTEITVLVRTFSVLATGFGAK